MLTKRYFNHIALKYRRALADANLFTRPLLEASARDDARYFAEENPRFNRERFLTACGVCDETCKESASAH